MVERIGSEYVGIQPESYELLVALAFYTQRLPQGPQRLREGLRAAAEKISHLNLGRFVDPETGELTSIFQESLNSLQEKRFLVSQGDSWVIPEDKQRRIESNLRTWFKEHGLVDLREAAAAARVVWFPSQIPG